MLAARSCCISVWCILLFLRQLRSGGASSPSCQTTPKDIVYAEDERPVPPSVHAGINLSPSQGTLAIDYGDGTTYDLFAEGSDRYCRVMALLANPSIRKPGSPFDWISRKVRISLGLTASPVSSAFLQVLNELRRQASQRNLRLTPVKVSAPHLPSLYADDIEDACGHAGLIYHRPPPHYDQPVLYETAAAYAGYGLGLCSNYFDATACREEELSMNGTTILTIYYGRTALMTSQAIVSRATDLYEPRHWRTANFQLGSDRRNEKGYWQKVSQEVITILWEFPTQEEPQKVVLTGESAGDRNFREMITRQVGGILEGMPPVFGSDEMFVAARGTAELSKRASWDWSNESGAEMVKWNEGGEKLGL